MSKHRYLNFPSRQVDGGDFLANQASSVTVETDELEDMAWSDSDADMEDSETDWNLSFEESDEEEDSPKSMSSLSDDTKFIVYKSSSEQIVPTYCLHCSNRLQETDMDWRVGHCRAHTVYL